MHDLVNQLIPLSCQVILLFISAGYSAAETALFSLPRLELRKLRQEQSLSSRTIVKLLSNPRQLLVLILLSNTFVNVLYSAVSATVAIQLASVSPVVFQFISIGLLILVAEVTPKAIAMQIPISVARLTAPLLKVSQRLLSPFQFLFGKIVQFISGFFLPKNPTQFITDEELMQLLDISESAGVIQKNERNLFSEIVSFRHLRVKEIMRPRVELVMHRADTPIRDLLNRAEETRQRIVPVYGETIDDILGAVKVRDILLYPDIPISELTKPVFFVPEIKLVDNLMREFLQKQRPFAVAVDEYGGVAGFITIDDIIAEIFGDTEMGTSVIARDFVRIDSGQYEISGRFSIRDLSEYLNIPFQAKGLTTLGGYVYYLLGAAPKKGDKVSDKYIHYTVTEVSHRKILRVKAEVYRRMRDGTHIKLNPM